MMVDAGVVKLHEDVRGRIFRVVIGDYEFLCLRLGGVMRRVGILILKILHRGSRKLEYRAKIGEREEVKIVGEDDVIFTEKDMPTILTALELRF